MLRSILIGLDGSKYSAAGIELSLRWARRFKARVAGLGVIDAPTICKPVGVPLGGGEYKLARDQSLLEDARRQVEEFLGAFRQQCEAEGVDYEVLEETGAPHAQILDESRRFDVTVLGRQTYFHFETQDWPDGTLREVLRHASRPVVTVPEQLPGPGPLLLAYNGSASADRALQALAASGLAEGEEVHVVSFDADEAKARHWAGQAVASLESHDICAVAHPLTAGRSAEEVIPSWAASLHAQLVVMGAYGRSMWREWLFGSITSNVLKDSAAPLFLCH